METEAEKIRKKLGLSRREMAEAMGTHIQTWIKWEIAERPPNAAARRLMLALVFIKDMGGLEAFLKFVEASEL